MAQGESAPVNPTDGHPFTDDGTDPGNCSVCHFYHRSPALASCGHPANEDGECGCSSWPERAPFVQDPANPTDAELAAAVKRGLEDGSLIDAETWMAGQCTCQVPPNGVQNAMIMDKNCPVHGFSKTPCPTCGCRNWTEKS